MSSLDHPIAVISSVDEGSPAWKCGIRSGHRLISVNGLPIRDIIDWQWESADLECEVTFIDHDDEEHHALLERDDFENWGISFQGIVFNGMIKCKNACSFCFMRQLPEGMRTTLSLPDDDYRLSFLQGNFVTLTNLDDDDVERIIEQNLSPLRVSLHAVDDDVRRRLMGKHAKRGLDNLETLLSHGIEFDAQIVLVPGENDGDVLLETLHWAFDKAGIRMVGIVPLGFTDHQNSFSSSFNSPERAASVIDLIKPIQKSALEFKGYPWVYAADEFYCNAYGDQVLEELPDSKFYGTYEMFEDGVGIIRSSVDEFEMATGDGDAKRCSSALHDAHCVIHKICGEAMRDYYQTLISGTVLEDRIMPLFVRNSYFGGNVNVTGLLCGIDIVKAISQEAARRTDDNAHDTYVHHLYAVPDVVFNADGVTLDDMTIEDVRRQTGQDVRVVPSNPLDCIKMIETIAKEI